MPKINSGRKLIQKLVLEYGTGVGKVASAEALFERDETGNPTNDVHADKVLAALKLAAEGNAKKGIWPSIPELTYLKAKEIRETGVYTPPKPYLSMDEYPVDEFPDEEPPAPAKNKGGRPKKAEAVAE